MATDYTCRKQLFRDTLACKRTDRVLAAPHVALAPMTMYGKTTVQEVMNDLGTGFDVFLKYHLEYQPDLAWGPDQLWPIPPLEALDCNLIRWPGRHFSEPNRSFQVPDAEYMKREEYEDYIEDPTGFMMRKILPRHYGKLKGLELIDLSNSVWMGALFDMIPFALPPVCETLATMREAGEFMMEFAEKSEAYKTMMAETVVENGGNVFFYTEEKYDAKLDLLATLPPGRTCVHLINSDLEKAKNVFAGKIAVSGGVDGPMLAFGTPDDVVKNVKNAIDVCAPGGGYFLNTSTSVDIAKPENMRALFDTVNTYMKY